MSREPVSLIVTVRNEERTLDALLDSVFAGSRSPDEVVVADGGSSDRTLVLLGARAAADPRLRVVSHPGNIAAGRNAAVRAARHGLIACTDAGVRVHPEWLQRLVARFASEPAVDAVAGFYRAVGETAFERAAAVLSAPRPEAVDPRSFLPSARSVAFRRSTWEAVGGFDESLAYAEDTWFALAIRRAGRRMAFEPEAVVEWRPRGDLRAFVRQYARYGRGDGGARIQGRFYATIASKYALAALLVVVGVRYRPAWLILGAAAAGFALLQGRRGWRSEPDGGVARGLGTAARVPLLKLAYDAALLIGYAQGRLGPRLRARGVGAPSPDRAR